MLDQKNSNYLLLAPTGVVTQNIGGKTIHSTLHIFTQGSFHTRIFINKDLYDYLKKLIL